MMDRDGWIAQRYKWKKWKKQRLFTIRYDWTFVPSSNMYMCFMPCNSLSLVNHMMMTVVIGWQKGSSANISGYLPVLAALTALFVACYSSHLSFIWSFSFHTLKFAIDVNILCFCTKNEHVVRHTLFSTATNKDANGRQNGCVQRFCIISCILHSIMTYSDMLLILFFLPYVVTFGIYISSCFTAWD